MPEDLQGGKLIEITEHTYLIMNHIKLPIFGKKIKMFEWETGLWGKKTWKENIRPVSNHHWIDLIDVDDDQTK